MIVRFFATVLLAALVFGCGSGDGSQLAQSECVDCDTCRVELMQIDSFSHYISNLWMRGQMTDSGFYNVPNWNLFCDADTHDLGVYDRFDLLGRLPEREFLEFTTRAGWSVKRLYKRGNIVHFRALVPRDSARK